MKIQQTGMTSAQKKQILTTRTVVGEMLIQCDSAQFSRKYRFECLHDNIEEHHLIDGKMHTFKSATVMLDYGGKHENHISIRGNNVVFWNNGIAGYYRDQKIPLSKISILWAAAAGVESKRLINP